FRNASNQYLQEDGSVSSNFNTFRGVPDVVGATSATWQYEVTLPHEGEWRMSATAIDNSGQSDLRSSTRDWLITSTGVAPTVAINTPAPMTPPTAAPPYTVAPGGRLTFSGTANDEDNLANVEITLRNTTTREQLASDGSWGTDVIQGSYRVSPSNISGASFDWTYTTPFNLTPGQYTFTVRATDDIGLTTSSANRGQLTINAQVAGDNFPNGLLNFTGTDSSIEVLHLDLAGTATDDFGVQSVRVSLKDQDTGRYVQPNGTMAAAFATLNATLATPGGTSTTWTLPVDLPTKGEFDVTAFAVDTAGQQDISTGATARYLVYPGDLDTSLNETLASPTEGTAFTEARIFVSGRAQDDIGLSRVEVAVVNSASQYMSSSGTFTSTTESWRSAFLNSPGTPGSNYSYTTPVIPSGAYRVRTRAVDVYGQVQPIPRDVNVTVSAPAGNLAPVASFTVSCNQNVCSFDGRASTDENAPTLTYSWNFGNGRTGSGPVPNHTYTTAGTFTVTLTVRDEYGLTGTTTGTVTIVEPAGNAAPNPVINPPACTGLVCNISGVGSADPNTGDTFTYLWDFGDSTPTSTSSAMSHTFPAAGTYTVTLTVTDGWGKANSTTRQVTVA
ncbi:MAG TPA: PKD domain-containing protein, partial [Actinomycetes bacterium]|nr:PKD domain-containing protein [Actinomycetes bacterium]